VINQRTALAAVFLLGAGCGSSATPGTPPVDAAPAADVALAADAAPVGGDAAPADSAVADDSAPALDGDPACSLVLASPPDEGANHVGECAPISPMSNPPASGNHYPIWPVFRVYSKPVPWGFLIHGLEHGAVVIAYDCPQGCADEVAKATAMIEAWPPKEGCSRPPIIMVPDPNLGVRWAASAWDHTLRASCFNREALATFIQAHANMGPEYFPTDCGTVDREATGWCPTMP
jgi:hypothetical protein